jgi:CBS domain-containing protein
MEKRFVRDWMTPNPITIVPKTALLDAHKLMRDSRIRRLPVVDRGRLVGIVTLGNVREAEPSRPTTLSIYELNYLLSKLTVDKIMTREPITISPNATVREAAQRMLDHKIGGLPVMDNDRLVGIITESDIFRVLVQELDPHPPDRLEEFQTNPYPQAQSSDTER